MPQKDKIAQALAEAHAKSGNNYWYQTRSQVCDQALGAHRGLMHQGYSQPHFIGAAYSAYKDGAIGQEKFREYQGLNDAYNGAKHSWKK